MFKVSPNNAAEYQHRICRAIDYINAHLAENPSVAEIARAAPFSTFHFQRLFRAIVGESVAEFTRRVRLETAARRLLFRPSEDITGLALDLGFSSSQNFARAFKKHFGVSPTQYLERDLSPANTVPATDGESIAARSLLHLTHNDDSLKCDIDVRVFPDTHVVYRRHFGSYHSPGVQAAFDKLQRWAEARQLHRDVGYIGIPWDDSDVTPNEKCRFDACLVIDERVWPGAGVNTQTIPAGRYAVYRCQIVNHDFDTPWTQLMRSWLPISGYQPADGPRFERYHSDGSRDAQGRWELDVCLPVVPLLG